MYLLVILTKMLTPGDAFISVLNIMSTVSLVSPWRITSITLGSAGQTENLVIAYGLAWHGFYQKVWAIPGDNFGKFR